jgi:hypothetical protein
MAANNRPCCQRHGSSHGFCHHQSHSTIPACSCCCLALQDILERVPGARLAFVGDGPAREELKAYFAGTPTVFTGMLHGEELSAAYASADVFVMPSETETLGE